MDEKTVSWKEYVDNSTRLVKEFTDAQLTNIKELLLEKVGSLDKAATVAKVEMERRLEGMNEFRATLTDQNTTFVKKDVYDAEHNKLEEEIDLVRLDAAEAKGKASQKSVTLLGIGTVLSLLFGLIGTIIAIIAALAK